jgi:hypothetical protein
MRQTENQPIGIHLSFESANRNNVLRQKLLLEHFECAYAAQIIKYIEKGIHNKKDSLKGVSHEIFWVLFWHVWIDLGLYKNL